MRMKRDEVKKGSPTNQPTKLSSVRSIWLREAGKGGIRHENNLIFKKQLFPSKSLNIFKTFNAFFCFKNMWGLVKSISKDREMPALPDLHALPLSSFGGGGTHKTQDRSEEKKVFRSAGGQQQKRQGTAIITSFPPTWANKKDPLCDPFFEWGKHSLSPPWGMSPQSAFDDFLLYLSGNAGNQKKKWRQRRKRHSDAFIPTQARRIWERNFIFFLLYLPTCNFHQIFLKILAQEK